jgi:uncharacterized repeat protein (TIGR03803 family)
MNIHSPRLVSCLLPAAILGMAAFSPKAHAQTLTTLYSFCAECGEDGVSVPNVDLVQAIDGDLYGTTFDGGTFAEGTIVRITTGGTATIQYSLGGATQHGFTPGSHPLTGLAQADNGLLYGTTADGGTRDSYGTSFVVSPNGTTFNTLNYFKGTGYGIGPSSALMQASNGNLYGTRYDIVTGAGTLISITPSGELSLFYSFCAQSGCADGSNPYGGLVQGSNGNLYGTTEQGGANQAGTVFEITAAGALTTLYSFCSKRGCIDGDAPSTGLVQSTDGDFYGTTSGAGVGGGTIFKMTPSGELTTLHTFCAQRGCPDGSGPVTSLILAPDGNLFGITAYGGAYQKGTAFEITPSGVLTTLYSFCSQADCADGELPTGLMLDTDGNLYGTTEAGGASLYGTFYRLSVGLSPFVSLLPRFASAGTNITILGTNLTGATAVTFNGTPASFNVVSAAAIEATVPAGATSGIVQVTTPNGVLSSNGKFHVNP